MFAAQCNLIALDFSRVTFLSYTDRKALSSSVFSNFNMEETFSDDKPVSILQQCAETAAFKSLGEVADKLCNPFYCRGRLEGQNNILLRYKSKETGELKEIRLPGAEKEALTQLLSAGSVASFGNDGEQVTDLSHCNTFKLDFDEIHVTTSFDVGSTLILSEIEMIMVPYRSIRAELHKLNMYTGSGGHFKSHVDTPRSEDMFGSLVVCLPTQFTGGALVTRHKGEEKVFDWSSSPEDPLNVVCWAAFFSDVEHEILPVTSGHCLTLTYNLYFDKKSGSISTPFVDQFQTALKEALYSPQFLPSGGCLGVDCKHLYVFTSLNETELLPHLLKGADYAVFSAAKSLGLKVSVKPIMEGDEDWYILPKFSSEVPGLFRSDGQGGEDDHGRFFNEQKCNCQQSIEWEMLDSVYNMLPIELPSGIINRYTQPSWKNVFQFATSPIGTTPEKLEEVIKLPKLLEEYKWNQESILSKYLNRKLSSGEISNIFSAVDTYWQHRGQVFGVYTHYENSDQWTADFEMCYQSAVILIELPPWGEMPRTLTTDSEAEAECEPPRKKAKSTREGIVDSNITYSWKKNVQKREHVSQQQKSINQALNNLVPKSMFLQLLQSYCRH